jgi:membrane protein YdbS with pleckstrin-like domain
MPVIACPDCGREVSTLAPACPHCGRPSATTASMGAPAYAAAPALPAQEETLWRGTASMKLLMVKVVVLVILVAGVPLLAHFLATKTNDLATAEQLVKGGWYVMGLLALLQLIAIITGYARLRGMLYTITNQRVMIERGILSKSLSEIDLRTIDDTQFVQTVSDRMMGIGNVVLVSSDKTLPMFVLRGIEDPRGVRELIRTHAYQVSQRQLFTRAT